MDVGDGTEYGIKYAYIDRTGKRISKKTYSAAFPFKNGIAKVYTMNYLFVLLTGGLVGEKSYYIDKSEKAILKGKE